MWLSNIRRMDWVLVICLAALTLASLFTIYSVDKGGNLFKAQAFWLVLAFFIFFLVAQIDWRPLVTYRWLILFVYFASLFLLVVTFFVAPVIRGTRAWLTLGSFQFQTSELVKLTLIITYSYYFARRHISIARWQNILIPFLYFAAPAFLVLLQPDMGTVLILFAIWLGYLLVSGIRWRHIFLGILVVFFLSFWGWNHFLAGYQRERLVGLFHPDYDPLGINYSVIQSKIAIGSAGFWGKGFMQGTQIQLGFLPEAASDFILAAFIEEWGLLGFIVFLAVFLTMVWRIIRAGLLVENNFCKLICLGTVIFLLAHFILNAGSTVGLLPVVGVPLSFFSYGGSNLLVSALLMGIVESVIIRSSF